MRPLEPVHTAALFQPLHDALSTLLRGLAPTDWERLVGAGRWRVRDVAAHLLDGDLRKLSAYRDGHAPPPDRPIGGYGELVAYLDQLNAEWVGAARRLSPRVILELLDVTAPAVAALVARLPPEAPSRFAVAWAGESASVQWMDTAREYTERWHHQMQIRDAVGATPLLQPRWLRPFLDVSVRALPRAYAATAAVPGAAIVLTVDGAGGGSWTVLREPDGWRVWQDAAPTPAATVRVDADAAWRLFCNGLPAEEARARARISGSAALAEPLLAARAVMV